MNYNSTPPFLNIDKEKSKFSPKRWVFDTISSFSLTEKIIFVGAIFVAFISLLLILLNINNQILKETPRFGGTLTEGVVGVPRFINPVLATSEADKDLTMLIYSGLTRIKDDVNLIPDLAESYSISEDGLEYTFILRGNAEFHDGKKVTTDDVEFTIENIKNPIIKSNERANWDGVTIEKVSDKEIKFILPEAYPAFLYNTALGILPKHIWENVEPEQFPFTSRNINPVGSGPYEVDKIKRSSSGIAEKYFLKSFNKFTLGKPHIEHLNIIFYKDEVEISEALNNNLIDSIGGLSPERISDLDKNMHEVEQLPLPRIFGVFFNQSQAPILASKPVREALSLAINRNTVVEDILYGYADIAKTPIPNSISPFDLMTTKSNELNNAESEVNFKEAELILKEAGFERNNEGILELKSKEGNKLLAFTLTTTDVPELVRSAEYVVSTWKSLGASVQLKIEEPQEFTQNIIRPRKYDAILFGQVISRDVDLFPFWHSSQRNDPGLNIADYANIDADAYLEDSRIETEESLKKDALNKVLEELDKDIPAVFLYSPQYLYVLPITVRGLPPTTLVTPSERFHSIYQWYIETDTVWRFF